MDNFTMAVVVSDIVMILAFLGLIVLDKRSPIKPIEPGGKRPA
jgi:hypothetical protein